MPSLSWYIRRASAMSAPELFHRAWFVQQKCRWKRRRGRNRPQRMLRTPDDDDAPDGHQTLRDHPGAHELLREADRYLDHQWLFFGADELREQNIDWHGDPVSGISAPLEFGFDINHRDEDAVGNIKVTWEKNRHHHLTVLAAAFAVTRNETYADEVWRQLTSWISDNPFPMGVNWTHPLEQGIRLIAWVWCERFLRGSKRHGELFGARGALWESIYDHQDFIARTYSRGSSANNHVIGEMAGLYAACSAWPYFHESERWKKLTRKILEEEALKQTFPSGLNREMAFSYHLFTLEFFLVCLDAARRSGDTFSGAYRDRVRSMVEVLPHVTDYGGNLPRYGDSDEGMAIQLQSRLAPRDAWLLVLGTALAGAQVRSPTVPPLATALMGYRCSARTAHREKAGTVAFEDAGIYILTSRRSTREEIFVVADAGPHGFLSIAAHAHADALSFTLSAAGIQFLVDPGTYVYHTQPPWRNYFRSTPAHNTVTVDGKDQSEPAGAFLWKHKANTAVTSWSDDGETCILTAHHDGFSNLAIVHHRTFKLRRGVLQLTDLVEGPGMREIASYFHFAPECEVIRVNPGRVKARRAGMTLDLTFPPDFDIDVAHGAPGAGWYSPLFGVRKASSTVRARASRNLPEEWTTMIRVGHES